MGSAISLPKSIECRKILAAACLLLLLLLASHSGAHAEARSLRPTAVHRKLALRRELSTKVTAPASVADDTTAFQKPRPNVRRKYAPARRLLEKAPAAESGVNLTVDSYGAAGDGKSDDTKAFVQAWTKACSSAQPATLTVPSGKKYLVKEVVLSGPCKSPVTFKLDGTLIAPKEKSAWSKQKLPRWVRFSNVENLTVTGTGSMDGNGNVWWKNSCRTNKKNPCTVAPTALSFTSCNHLKVENIKLLDSPQIHLWVEDCHDVTLSHLTITAAGNSPETDGIHISRSEDVRILKATIKTGDDCISIETGTKHLYANNIECGPGHGISIGSLGDHNSEAQVSDITIDGAHLSGTLFGARIKSWQGGRGYAKDIKFMNMVMDNDKNPIIIDQNYCITSDPTKPKVCEQQESAVQFSNILFKNIKGTTATKDAIKLHCSKAFPCRDIILQDIDLKMKAGGKKNTVTSSCENAVLGKSSNVSPVACTSAVTKEEIAQEQE